MHKYALAIVAAFVIGQVEAALPPLYQTSKEIVSIMTDDQLGKKLQSGEVIEKIEKNEDGYEISTNKNKVQVKVVYQPAERPGPARYHLVFENPVPQ